MSNGFPQQPMQQMTMPGYGQPYQQPMMPQMPGMDANMQRYISDMRQKLDDYERRFSQPPQYQMPQQPMAQPQQQQSTDNQRIMLVVSSIDEAQNYPPDISGKKQWFVVRDEKTGEEEPCSKQFNVKTAGLSFLRYGSISDSQEQAQEAAGAHESESPKLDRPDTIEALQAKIEGLEKKQQELEARLDGESNGNDGKPLADAATEHAAGVSAANADGKRGAKPKPNNRLGATEKTPTGTDAARADS